MKTFETYQEAKIAMPKACIVKYKYDGNYRFTGMPTREGTTLCNGSEFAEPQDHCMTVKQFLDAGHKFVDGDFMLGQDGLVVKVSNCPSYNMSLEDDDKRYVLKSKAPEETNAIPTETPEEKEALDAIEKTYRYEKVEASEAVYWFTKTDDALFSEPDSSQRYDDLQDYINNLDECGSSSLYRRIEVTERDEFIDTQEKMANEDGYHINRLFLGWQFDNGVRLVNGKG